MSEPLTPSPEERHFRRVPIDYQVKLVADDRIIAYPRAINLSMGGILLSGPARLPMGSHCGVAILFASPEAGRRVVARGTVVRTDGQGMAIAFSKALDPASEDSLRRLIHSLEPGAEQELPTGQRQPSEGAATTSALAQGTPSPADKAPESSLAVLMDRIKPGSARHVVIPTVWEPPSFPAYEDIREWLKESVMSATIYERYPDGRWTIQMLLKEQNPGTYRYIVL
jgi:hypothetical protein